MNRDVPACGFSIGFERIMDLLGRVARSGAVALLFDSEVPLPEALRIGRDLRADGRAISAIRRTGQLGKQLARLEEWGFTSLVRLLRGTLVGRLVMR